MVDIKDIIKDYFKCFDIIHQSNTRMDLRCGKYGMYINTSKNSNHIGEYIVMSEEFSSRPVFVAIDDNFRKSLDNKVKNEMPIIYNIIKNLNRVNVTKDILG